MTHTEHMQRAAEIAATLGKAHTPIRYPSFTHADRHAAILNNCAHDGSTYEAGRTPRGDYIITVSDRDGRFVEFV